MKYKFLLRLYKSSNNVILDSDEAINQVKNYIYTKLQPLIYKYKTEHKNVDCSVLDELLDKCLLAGELICGNIEKEYKVLKKFISKLSMEQFKIIHEVRLILENKIVKEEATLNCSESKLIAFSCFILILTICEGGVIYLPLKYKDKTINIGRQLDSLIDLKQTQVNDEHPIIRYTAAYDATERPNKEFVRTLNKKIIECSNKFEGIIYNKYYMDLLNLAFALSNPQLRSKIENYLTQDSFKYSAQYLALAIKEDKNLRERYVVKSDIAEALYNRKVLLPESGVVIKNKKEKCSTIVCEYDDEIFGRMIFWYTWMHEIGVSQPECVFLTDRVATLARKMPGTEDVLNTYEIADKFEDSKIEFISLSPVLNNKTGEKIVNVIRSTINVNEKHDMYTPVYWKYKDTTNNVQTSKSEDKLYGQEIKLLAPFKRNLPKGQKRSEEASALAKKLCINLKDNETVVSAFERKQRIRIK